MYSYTLSFPCCKLAVYGSRLNVVLVECYAELIPDHLVIVLNSCGICGPPHTYGRSELLTCEQGLLKLRAVKQTKLRLSHSKLVFSFNLIYHLSEHWWVCCSEVEVGGLLRLLVMLRTSFLMLIDIYQPLHDGIDWCQQLLEAHWRHRWRGCMHRWTECPTTTGWGLRDIIVHALS
jgi:hypothetical protein